MSIVHYAEAEQVAGLVEGVETNDVAEAWLEDADQMIDSLLGYSLDSIKSS